MIINAEALARLYTGFTAVFNAAFQGTDTWYAQVAMTVPASTRIMDYKFLLDFPMVREWLGDRQISALEPKAYQVESKDWEATIEVERNDVEDDQLGFYNPIVAALAQEAKKHPERLIANLMTAGFTTACFDGQYFFDIDHPVGAGTASNYGGGSGTAWYLLDTGRAIKPSSSSCGGRCNWCAWTAKMMNRSLCARSFATGWITGGPRLTACGSWPMRPNRP